MLWWACPQFVFNLFNLKAGNGHLLWFKQTAAEPQIHVLFMTWVKKSVYRQKFIQLREYPRSFSQTHHRPSTPVRHSSGSLRLFLPSTMLVLHWQCSAQAEKGLHLYFLHWRFGDNTEETEGRTKNIRYPSICAMQFNKLFGGLSQPCGKQLPRAGTGSYTSE